MTNPQRTSLATDIVDLLKNEINGWKAENKIILDKVPQTLIDSAVSSAVAASIPKAYLTPQLANLKMKYAAEALKAAVDTRNQMDGLQAQLKDRLMVVVGKVLIMLVAQVI
jgi:hypothetical protein